MFFSKQKTAYEMRISDWSSDVCSSDLAKIIELGIVTFSFCSDGRIISIRQVTNWLEDPGFPLSDEIVRLTGITNDAVRGQAIDDDMAEAMLNEVVLIIAHNAVFDRSEEHTSELQSLMRISYAVFCLKNK